MLHWEILVPDSSSRKAAEEILVPHSKSTKILVLHRQILVPDSSSSKSLVLHGKILVPDSSSRKASEEAEAGQSLLCCRSHLQLR